jgi:hypothetical protein
MGIMKRVKNNGMNGTTSPSSGRNYVPLLAPYSALRPPIPPPVLHGFVIFVFLVAQFASTW